MSVRSAIAKATVGVLAAGCFIGLSSGAAFAVPSDTCGTSHNSNTGNGANTSGAYDPNCQGQPSMNGNGGGNATGRPCAGCVGNADAKNPPGQAPDGTDANNGYECDGNSGIGKTNPAHTGCASSTTTS